MSAVQARGQHRECLCLLFFRAHARRFLLGAESDAQGALSGGRASGHAHAGAGLAHDAAATATASLPRLEGSAGGLGRRAGGERRIGAARA